MNLSHKQKKKIMYMKKKISKGDEIFKNTSTEFFILIFTLNKKLIYQHIK
jgi:hypothetical protein